MAEFEAIGTQNAEPAAASAVDTSPYWDEIKALRDEVLALIEPYYGNPNGRSAPFTCDELIVLAIIASGSQPIDRMEICRLMCSRFSKNAGPRLDAGTGGWSFKHDPVLAKTFAAAFESYEMPLVQTPLGPDVLFDSHGRVKESEKTWSVDPRAARIYLSKYLAPKREGHFDLLSLPTELRNIIYEYALSYPGLLVNTLFDGLEHSWFTVSRPLMPHHLHPLTGIWDSDLHTRTLDQILSVVHCNKQLYREALPVFFKINGFQLPTVQRLDWFVRCMLLKSSPLHNPQRTPLCSAEPHRTQHITRLHLAYERWDDMYDRHLCSLYGELLHIKRFKELTVVVEDGDWWDEYDREVAEDGKQRCFARYSGPSELPGMPQLAQLLRKAESYEIR